MAQNENNLGRGNRSPEVEDGSPAIENGATTGKRNAPAVKEATAIERCSPENRLIWLDMEMTGLDPEKERIIEVAVVVTEANLVVVAEGPALVIHQPDSLLEAMDSWNQSTHRKSGLIDKVKNTTRTEAQAQTQLLDFLAAHVPPGKSPLCGNSVSQDRRFMVRYMPELEKFFHYRHIDVSTLKELVRRWRPDLYKSFTKTSRHEALADVYDSIEELKYYRLHFLNAVG
jgi:oligoribonuclease